VCIQFSFSYVGEKTDIPLPKENSVFQVKQLRTVDVNILWMRFKAFY